MSRPVKQVSITEEMHREAKVMAAREGITLSFFVDLVIAYGLERVRKKKAGLSVSVHNGDEYVCSLCDK